MLKTTDLALRIKQKTLVTGLNWSIAPGQCWCIIGRNGVGKSTLLRSLAGLHQPHAGAVQLDGKLLSEWSLRTLALRRAYLPPGHNDAFGYSVIELVLSARHPYHESAYWDSPQDHQVAYAALHQMEVDALAARDVRTLSSGERQRVAIAAVLAQDTDFLLLDEPTNALDISHQAKLVRLLKGVCQRQGKAIVMISHDLNLIHAIASHVLLLMGDGSWLAGEEATVMQPAQLHQCLGHPIEMVQHHGRLIYAAQHL